jgi:peptide/nickel transport system ATP-binding protein
MRTGRTQGAVTDSKPDVDRSAVLSVRDLTVSFPKVTTAPVVRGVSFDLRKGEHLGIVGESGSGKSVTAQSIAGLVQRRGGRIDPESSITFDGHELTTASERTMRGIRGRRISMVFQDPMASLNPVLTVGQQIAEALQVHGVAATRADAWRSAVEWLGEVGIPRPEDRARAYPHEFSGGMRQRAMIAMALCAHPDIVIADEPTTALDVTVQARVLRLLRRLSSAQGAAVILITHDLGITAEFCDRLLVMYAGSVAESGAVEDLHTRTRHPYTVGLMRCVPSLEGERQHELPTIRGNPPVTVTQWTGCPFYERCDLGREDPCALHPPPRADGMGTTHTSACHLADEVRPWVQEASSSGVEDRRAAPTEALLQVTALRKTFHSLGRGGSVTAVDGVSLELAEGQTLGIVGESGSGKSTLARCLLRLVEPSGGSVRFQGTDVLALSKRELRPWRRSAQMIFQDPYGSFDPRMRIRQIVAEPMAIFGRKGSRKDAVAAVMEMLDRVGLSSLTGQEYPHELSGGQQQRVSIARALILHPRLLVLDEAVSALDVSIRGQVLNLLNDVKDELGLSYLLISHDLSVVRHFCDDVLIMQSGRVVEGGPTDHVLHRPQKEYTAALVAAVPSLGGDVERAPGGAWPDPERASGSDGGDR